MIWNINALHGSICFGITFQMPIIAYEEFHDGIWSDFFIMKTHESEMLVSLAICSKYLFCDS